MTWYNQLRFSANPLDIRPNIDLVGLADEEDRLINFIKKGDVCFLSGFTGSGKTSLLTRVQKKLRNHHFIYLNAEDIPKEFSLGNKLKNMRSFVDKLTFRKTPKKQPVLLIDEFQATDPNLVLEAKGKWEKKTSGIRAIVIAQITRELHNASGSFKERIGNRNIQLRSLTDEEMEEILKRRLFNKKTKKDYFAKLHKDAIGLIIKHADANPRRLLEYADALFDFHYRKFKDINPVLKDEYKISFYAARDILAGMDVTTELKNQNKKSNTYTAYEKRILRFIRKSDVVTSADIAGKFKTTRKKVSGVVSSLKQKGAIISAGSRNNLQQWALAPGVKRMLVKT